MPTNIFWSALGSSVVVIPGAGVGANLQNLANASNVLAATAFNNNNSAVYAMFTFSVRGASAFSAGGYMGLWFVKSADGSTYEDGDYNVTPARPVDVVCPVRAVSTQQVINIGPVVIPDGSFKPLFTNQGGQALTNTSGENTLAMATFTDQVQ